MVRYNIHNIFSPCIKCHDIAVVTLPCGWCQKQLFEGVIKTNCVVMKMRCVELIRREETRTGWPCGDGCSRTDRVLIDALRKREQQK